jgi:dephospho-CoA kinase
MLKIYLTGGIGSGKTLVSGLFAEKGVPVIDTDLISRQIVQPGQPALEEIQQAFGSEILTTSGELDRRKLRELVFHNTEAKKTLEAILHPKIYTETERQLQELNSPFALIVVPLLVETGETDRADRILVVDASSEIQKSRVRARDKVPDQQIEQTIASQASREQRLALADDVIVNIDSIEDVQLQVNRLYQKYLNLAKSKAEMAP